MSEGRLTRLASEAGITAWVHATRLGGPPASTSAGADVPVAVASLYKLPLALVWADLVEAGALDPHSRLLLRAEQRAAGPTGVAMLWDDVALSQRDAVRLMLAVSDNTCADEILRIVGLRAANAALAADGLEQTHIRHGSAETLRIVQAETGAPDPAAAERALATVDEERLTSQFEPALASSSTARELCRVLALLWGRTGRAHEAVRGAMAHQAWRHRIASAFPHDDVLVQGKTGTLARLRHEAAVVTFPGEFPIAVAVLTRSARAERHLPRVDAAIGAIARAAAGPLRMSRDDAPEASAS
ncbi:serine hydrolase [Pseudactinotalea sp. HY160]|uniref:serine hydrolase n=1 Tax=Pseudactinotalea sp. HY160 TaxID=2654490 RepID=UPI00128DE4A9|nr:serine hydrolase [Pseudactinotalea sp. HY160]MPV50247.1 serine hydrolase [Pseudactinotalea sp. HY160]